MPLKMLHPSAEREEAENQRSKRMAGTVSMGYGDHHQL